MFFPVIAPAERLPVPPDVLPPPVLPPRVALNHVPPFPVALLATPVAVARIPTLVVARLLAAIRW